jgi:hypothetical protein
MTGIDVSGRVILPGELQQQIEAAGIPLPHGLTLHGPDKEPPPPGTPLNPTLPQGTYLYTYDDQGNPADLPPEAVPIVEAYSPSATKPAS